MGVLELRLHCNVLRTNVSCKVICFIAKCLIVFWIQGKSSAPETKEGLGRATWTFLHTLAAQVTEIGYVVYYPI